MKGAGWLSKIKKSETKADSGENSGPKMHLQNFSQFQ